MRRVNKLMLEVVADEVAGLKDPRIGFLTITGVNTSPDLRKAIVYYSVIGSAEDAAATAAALDSAGPRLQRAVGTQTRLKFTPVLSFDVDPSIRSGETIDRVLRKLDADSGKDLP
jgi:ribosome-binding factor A